MTRRAKKYICWALSFALGAVLAWNAQALDIVPPDNAVCWSTQPDEVLQTAVVALMDAGTQRRSTTLKPPFTVREFTHTFSKAGTVALNITGIRIICTWTVPAPSKEREIRTTSQFAIPVAVPIGDSPKLRVRIDQSQGQWTVTILNAAQLGAPAPPPPAPPPPSGASPDGTKLPPAAQIMDSAGAKWTLGPPTGQQFALLRNGAQVAASIDFATIKGGVVYASDFISGNGWQVWSGGTWVASGAP